MATVTLRRINQLHTQGKLFKRGFVTPVTRELATALQNDPRFFVNMQENEAATILLEERGLTSVAKTTGAEGRRSRVASEIEHNNARPRDGQSRTREIKSASDLIGPDQEDAWAEDGRPTVEALEEILGWRPTNPDMLAAFPPAQVFDETRAVRKTRTTIIRKPAKKLDEPLDTGAAVVVASKDPIDL